MLSTFVIFLKSQGKKQDYSQKMLQVINVFTGPGSVKVLVATLPGFD